MNSRSKIPPITQFWKSQKEGVVQYVGIAVDEKTRLDRVVQSANQVSLLQKYGYTEEMAKQKCIEYGLLSPIYEFTKRNGCWFCPNQRMNEMRHLRTYHYDLWQRLIELSDEEIANPYFNCFEETTIKELEEQFMWEDAQMDIFDFIEN